MTSAARRVLVLDGGGVKGISQAVVLLEIEKSLNQRIAKTFDLVVGSSVGAILGSVLSTGVVSAFRTYHMMQQVVPQLFSRRPWPLLPKYSRDPFHRAWFGLGLDGFQMKDCRTRYMCTAVSYIDKMTHFFKSWHHNESNRPLYDVQVRSWAAPLYFGKIVDNDGVWGDGGCGLANCPLSHAITQTLRLGWLGRDRVHVLSLGTGYSSETSSRDSARRIGNIRQVLQFISPDDGGWARYEAAHRAVKDAEAIVGHVPGYTFQRVDAEIPAKIDKLDGKDWIDQYAAIGQKMAATVNYDLL